ncbi:hypothetical protein PGTUg99_035819 [Puccinia graminis f. sp. tritici]|nr:hypothetical protein PGTUg99_035819 [Puccinia graminis f. sp. tritici]
MSVQRSPVNITTRAAAFRLAASQPVSDKDNETFMGARKVPDLGASTGPGATQTSDLDPARSDACGDSLDHRTENVLIRYGTAR